MMRKTACIEFIESGLTFVIEEFGNAFAANIPERDRDIVVRAVLFAWLSEQLTAAVRQAKGYERFSVVENGNTFVRLGHAGFIERYPEIYPHIFNVLDEQ